jgi:hypothetical protein
LGTLWEHQNPKKISTHTAKSSPNPWPPLISQERKKLGFYGVHVDRAHEIFILVPMVPSIHKMGCFPSFFFVFVCFFLFFFLGLVEISHFDWLITKKRTETLETSQNRSFCVNK